jgi:hypothetical protein
MPLQQAFYLNFAFDTKRTAAVTTSGFSKARDSGTFRSEPDRKLLESRGYFGSMSKRKRRRGQEGKAIVPGSRFSEQRLTSRAALIIVARIARKFGLSRIIDETVHVMRGANGSVVFLRETLAQLPKRVWEAIIRADFAFFNIEFGRLSSSTISTVGKRPGVSWLCADSWEKETDTSKNGNGRKTVWRS